MPKLPGPPRGHDPFEKPIIDAQWTDVDDDPSSPRRTGYWTSVAQDLLSAVKHIFVALGILAAILIVVAVFMVEDEPSAEATEQARSSGQGDSETVSGIEPGDEWDPSQLCNDEQVLSEVQSARREWLQALLDVMAEEGSYVLPNVDSPTIEGAAGARIEFPLGAKSLDVEMTGGATENDEVLVRCEGRMVVQNAFMLPNGSWSDAALIMRKSQFDIRAGTKGFTLEFPSIETELRETTITVAGATMNLDEFRQMTRGPG